MWNKFSGVMFLSLFNWKWVFLYLKNGLWTPYIFVCKRCNALVVKLKLKCKIVYSACLWLALTINCYI